MTLRAEGHHDTMVTMPNTKVTMTIAVTTTSARTYDSQAGLVPFVSPLRDLRVCRRLT
jgi:hypothetical protein